MSAKWPIEYLIKVLENIIFWGEDFSMSCHHHKVIIQITKEIEITVEGLLIVQFGSWVGLGNWVGIHISVS